MLIKMAFLLICLKMLLKTVLIEKAIVTLSKPYIFVLIFLTLVEIENFTDAGYNKDNQYGICDNTADTNLKKGCA